MTAKRTGIHTIGHSIHDIGTFIALLRRHGITAVADVRRFPGSRRNPQFNADPLAAALRSQAIAIEQFGETLGGRRRALPGSPNGGWRVGGFRGYADHMASEAFGHGLDELEVLAGSRPTALMCAEADWHRCHRRLIADALAARGWSVAHIAADGTVEQHRITSFAVVDGGRITYPPAQQSLA